MHLTALIVLFFVSVVPAQISDEKPSGYHQLVGIPRAQSIKAWEERIQSEDNSRIYNGHDVWLHELEYYSFVAGLLVHLTSGDLSYCGAALVTPNMLLSAAHCWMDGEETATLMTVVLGSTYLYSGGERINTSNVIPHPGFNKQTQDNDIAAIHLPHNVKFSRTIFPIELPRRNELNMTFLSRKARAVGYGNSGGEAPEGILRFVDLEVISNDECATTYTTGIPDNLLCTSGNGGKCVHHGDSGGPLFTYTNKHKILIGIASGSNSCGAGFVGTNVYTRVTSYMDFIRSQGRQFPKFSYRYIPKPGEMHEYITILYYPDYPENPNAQLEQLTHFSILRESDDAPALKPIIKFIMYT